MECSYSAASHARLTAAWQSRPQHDRVAPTSCTYNSADVIADARIGFIPDACTYISADGIADACIGIIPDAGIHISADVIADACADIIPAASDYTSDDVIPTYAPRASMAEFRAGSGSKHPGTD